MVTHHCCPYNVCIELDGVFFPSRSLSRHWTVRCRRLVAYCLAYSGGISFPFPSLNSKSLLKFYTKFPSKLMYDCGSAILVVHFSLYTAFDQGCMSRRCRSSTDPSSWYHPGLRWQTWAPWLHLLKKENHYMVPTQNPPPRSWSVNAPPVVVLHWPTWYPTINSRRCRHPLVSQLKYAPTIPLIIPLARG